MKKMLMLLGVTLVAGCGSSDTGQLKAGKWRMTSRVEDIVAEGMPAAAVAQMKQVKPAPVEVCLTDAMVSAPGGNFFGTPAGGSCKSEGLTMADGKLEAKTSCQMAGSKQTIDMSGTFTPERYELKSTTVAETPGAGTVKTIAKVVGERVGNC